MIRQIAPVFFTMDIPATLAYYTGKLGFACLGTWQDPPVYAIVTRDQQVIHFRCAAPPTANPDKYADELLDAYVFVEDADALYAEYAAQGVEFTRGLGNMPWHCREIVVKDCDGRLLAFGANCSLLVLRSVVGVAIGSIVTKLRFCVMEQSLMLSIRPATVSDVPLLLRFSRELAEYERQADAVVINEETLGRDGFGSQPKFRSLIAEWDGEAIGYALFFGFYSSLKGSAIFLEDLFVREAFRSRGIGRAILCEIARIARQEGSYGVRWEVLAGNESAIKFYKSLGSEFFDEWRQVLLQADALNRLADG